jgi:hypothetical protein
MDGEGSVTASRPLTVNMRTAIGLLELFVVAIVLAFLVTVSTGTLEMQVLAVGLITPIIILSLVFIRYCRMRKAWSYAGASILGILGVILRVIVSTQPSLDVGGGLPVGVTVLYIVLGSLVALKNYECVLELKTH